jgi:hypothetical protein
MLANDWAIDRLSANELDVNNEIARKIATPRPFMYISFLLSNSTLQALFLEEMIMSKSDTRFVVADFFDVFTFTQIL